MTKEHLFVFDHDGTLTDGARTNVDYTDAFYANLAEETRLPRDVIANYMEGAKAEILRHPKLYAWQNKEGYKVAPATVDTFTLNTEAARIAIPQMKVETSTRLPETPAETQALLEKLFFASYPRVGPHYREDAARSLRELQELGKVIIVSNSHPDHLRQRLAPFLAENNLPEPEVVGNARKYFIDPSWSRVSSETHFPGLPRPVLLRRSNYGTLLLNLGTSPHIIIGDSAELDHVTPHALNMKTALLVGPNTPDWEEAYYRRNPSLGFMADSLDDITQRITSEVRTKRR